MKITAKAYAKINWSLAICADRPDGYHELDMLMQSIDLHDELTFENARRLSMTADGGYVPCDGRNLVLRAAQALNDALGLQKGARITLKKRIPSRAGLGGGSADCAAALIALNRLWGLRLPMRTLMQLGLSLGADVPFCLQGGFAHACGVGEVLTPIEASPSYPMVMITPGGGLSTPAVFRAWNECGMEMRSIDSKALAQAIVRGDWNTVRELSRNDLERPAIELMPQIAQLLAFFRENGAVYTRMSGSGSTVYGIFETEAEAKRVSELLSGSICTATRGSDT